MTARLTFAGAGAAALVAASMALLAPAASAQAEAPGVLLPRGDGYSYYKRTESDKPKHGYSGFAGGPFPRYCDYRRIPNRVCDRGGCRVASWTLEQYCY